MATRKRAVRKTATQKRAAAKAPETITTTEPTKNLGDVPINLMQPPEPGEITTEAKTPQEPEPNPQESEVAAHGLHPADIRGKTVIQLRALIKEVFPQFDGLLDIYVRDQLQDGLIKKLWG